MVIGTYGDTDAVRALARRLAAQAVEIVEEADRLVTQAQACGWSGLAADAMRRRNRDRAAALRRTAAHHEDAADALTRHADAVDRVREVIASAERKVHAVLGGLGLELHLGLDLAVPCP
jgi:hypothetical protein